MVSSPKGPLTRQCSDLKGGYTSGARIAVFLIRRHANTHLPRPNTTDHASGFFQLKFCGTRLHYSQPRLHALPRSIHSYQTVTCLRYYYLKPLLELKCEVAKLCFSTIPLLNTTVSILLLLFDLSPSMPSPTTSCAIERPSSLPDVKL